MKKTIEIDDVLQEHTDSATRLRALAWSHKHPSPFRKRTRKERGLDK